MPVVLVILFLLSLVTFSLQFSIETKTVNYLFFLFFAIYIIVNVIYFVFIKKFHKKIHPDGKTVSSSYTKKEGDDISTAYTSIIYILIISCCLGLVGIAVTIATLLDKHYKLFKVT
jgi:hypothetical protein